MAAKTYLKSTLAILGFLFVLGAFTTACGQIIYVDDDATGANDGSSWADAFNYLQDALAAANDGDEIRVAQGIYKPDRGNGITPGDREATFQLKNGATLKGGYIGLGSPDPNVRDVNAYQTILTGDLKDDDLQVKDPLVLLYEPTRAENSYHVLTSIGTGVIDGFIITAGNAMRWPGGGLQNFSGSPILINCIFRGNSSGRSGGGLYNELGSPTLINCVFSGNSARGGGGMWCGDSGKPTLTNCTFSGNSARFYGGGMGNNESAPTLTNCIFWGNSDSTGVELWAQISGGDAPIVNYSCIQGLMGNFGGTCNIGDDPLFVEAHGADNIPGTADDNLRLLPGSPCIDAGDNSAIPPQVFTDLDGDPRIVNGTVDMGAYEGPDQGFLLSNESVTVPEGMTASFSVELALDPQGMLEVTVSRQSGDPDITVESGASLTFDSSNYFQPQTVTLAAAEDLDNLNSSALIKMSGPKFLAAGFVAIEQDNDLPAGNILFVDAYAPGLNTGLNWAEAYTELQDALTVERMYPGHVEEIWVAEGTYKPDQGVGLIPGDQTATFQLINNVAIRGAYAGYGETDPNARDIQEYETILSGDLNGNDLKGVETDDLLNEPTRHENSYHVVTGSATDVTAVLDGFNIIAGNADGFWDAGYSNGGGMYNNPGSPTLKNCTFTANSARDFGGAISNYRGSSPKLSGCAFSQNCAGHYGGGIRIEDGSNPTMINCTFSSNSAQSGGGVSINESSPTLTNCVFSDNTVHYKGGGIYNDYHSSLHMANCIFSGNSAGYRGGGVHNFRNVNLVMTNCTFYSNFAPNGNAMACDSYLHGPSNVQAANCIFRGSQEQIFNADGSTIDIVYSNVQAGWLGEGNINADPRFVDPGYWDANGVWVDGDYHLLPDSPCIDAGDPNYLAEPNETDLDGRPRIIGGRIDMGAYEAPIFAEARILPRTINLASKGNWISCYIWLPDEYDVADIEPNSIFLEDEIKPDEFLVDKQQQVATARFNREDVQSILDIGDVELKITGRLTDGNLFEGTDTVKVINKAGKN